MKFRTKKEEVPEQPPKPPVAGESQPTAAPQPENGKPTEPPAATPPTAPTAPVPPAPPVLPQPPQPHPAEERLLRMRADFDNLRKRFDRERLDMAILSNERLIKELLPVMDHFELAINAAAQQKTEKAVQDGFRMVYEQLNSALSGFGLKPIDAQDKPFDPNFHEAITQQPSEEVPEHVVIAQTRRGYQLGDRLLRPANVIVSSGPAKTPTAPAKE